MNKKTSHVPRKTFSTLMVMLLIISLVTPLIPIPYADANSVESISLNDPTLDGQAEFNEDDPGFLSLNDPTLDGQAAFDEDDPGFLSLNDPTLDGQAAFDEDNLGFVSLDNPTLDGHASFDEDNSHGGDYSLNDGGSNTGYGEDTAFEDERMVSFFEWDLSALPADITITNVVFKYHCSQRDQWGNIYAMEHKPSTASAETIYGDAQNGTLYVTSASETFPIVGESKEIDLGTDADDLIQTRPAWFAIGCSNSTFIDGETSWIWSEDFGAPIPAPTLYIEYTLISGYDVADGTNNGYGEDTAFVYERKISFFEWSLGDLPADITITNVVFKYHCSQRDQWGNIYAMEHKPSTASAETIYGDAQNGTLYVTSASKTFPIVGEDQEIDLGTDADDLIQTRPAWFAIGCSNSTFIDGENSWIWAEDYGSAVPKPTLYIEYTLNSEYDVADGTNNGYGEDTAFVYERKISFFEWSLGDLPANITITNVSFKYHSSGRDQWGNIYAMEHKPSTASAETIYGDAQNGTLYVTTGSETFPIVGEDQEIDLGTDADDLIQTRPAWFAIGCSPPAFIDGENSWIWAEDYGSAVPKPTLYIEYTLNTEYHVSDGSNNGYGEDTAFVYERKISFFEWDLSALPADVTIIDVVFKYHSSGREQWGNIYEMEHKPSTASAETIYGDAQNGTLYVTSASETFPIVGEDQEIDLGTDADDLIQSGPAWFAIGCSPPEFIDGNNSWIWSEDYGSAVPKPTLYIEYMYKLTVTFDIDNLTADQTVDYFEWGSSWGDSAFWYTDYPWVFEGKRRYSIQINYENETISTIEQCGLRFTDELEQTHTIWYDQDANTLTVTSPSDGISGWLQSFSQVGTNVTAIFQIMFNKPIPDSYGVQLEARLVAGTDSGWLSLGGGLFNIYNLGGLSTLYSSGTAGRIPGGDIFEIYAADTRTRNIVPYEPFRVRPVPLSEGWQEFGIQITPAGDEQALLDEIQGWKWWLSTRTENRTIYPTNRKPTGAGTDDVTYVSFPFGLKIKANPITINGLMAEKQFFRKITPSDNEMVTVQVHAMTPQTTGTTGKILITDDGYVDDLNARVALDSKQAVDLVFAGNGSIRLTNGSAGYIYPATYTGMTWYNFTMVLNCTAQSYDLYVDEVLNATNIDFRQKVAGADSVGHITFLDMLMESNFTEFYIDDIWVYTDFTTAYGGISEATMLFDKNQHWSMDFDFFVEQGKTYAQGSTGTPAWWWQGPGGYSDYGYLEFGWDVMINKTLIHDFLVARVNITDGHISGRNNWVKFNVSWYEQGVIIKNDMLYGLFEGYSIFPGGEKDTIGWHWDIWFNRANASTVVGARLNTQYYGLSDESVWWAIWSSKWTPMRSEVSESTLFIDLRDNNSVIHSANDVSFVRSWVKVLRTSQAQFSYKVLNIAGLDFLVATDTMSGIDTPPIRETLVPDVLSGFFGSALGAIFMAALKRLGNTLAGFGMGFFTMSVAFIDNIFAALGYPALVTTIFGWMDSLFANVPTLLGYGLTLVDQIFSMITISAGNTLTQLTSIITIWIGMYSTVMDMLNGVLTPGINLWNDLGVGSFIRIGAVLYPLYLLMMASDKGGQAVIDHLNGLLNIGSFFLNFILNVAGFFVSLLTGLIGAIRG